MKKIKLPATAQSAEKAAAFIRDCCKGKPYVEDDQAMPACAREVVARVARLDGAGEILLDVDASAAGITVQFMYAGPIFDASPCFKNGHACINIDEISFEFKYGRNVLTVFRRIRSEQNTKKNEGKQMKTIQIRKYTLQAGSKIIPIAENNLEAIVAKAKKLAKDDSVCAVEWRVDKYENVFEIRFEDMPKAITAVRKALGDKLLLYTFRDKSMGGAHPATCMYVTRLNNLAVHPGEADLVTVAWYGELDAAISGISAAHEGGKLVVASWCTEEAVCKERVEQKLTAMLESKGDILEYGSLCRDQTAKEALTAGVLAFKAKHPEVPVILSAKGEDDREEKILF